MSSWFCPQNIFFKREGSKLKVTFFARALDPLVDRTLILKCEETSLVLKCSFIAKQTDLERPEDLIRRMGVTDANEFEKFRAVSDSILLNQMMGEPVPVHEVRKKSVPLGEAYAHARNHATRRSRSSGR